MARASPAMSRASSQIHQLRLIQPSFNSSNYHFKHVHALLLRSGRLHHDTRLLNAILKRSFQSRNFNYALLLFDQIERPNVYLFNTMIQGLVASELFSQGIRVYLRMRMDNFLPDNFAFPFLLKACTRVSDLNLGLNLHNLVVKVGCCPDEFVKTSLVCMYAKLASLNSALQVFDEMSDRSVVCWTALVKGYIDSGRFREAVEFFKRMLDMGLRPDSYMLVRVLQACTRLGDLGSMEWIHGYVVDAGMDGNVFVGTCVLDMYVKCGNMDKALSVFERMPAKDNVSWNTMIQGLASNGLPHEVLKIFSRMRDENLMPDCYSMVGVLSACASLGALEVGKWASSSLDRNEFLSNPILGTALIDMYAKCGDMSSALNVFNGMKERDTVAWNSVITGLAMNGHEKGAVVLFGQFVKCGFCPNRSTFIGLLCACTHGGLISLGRRVFSSINDIYGLAPTVEHYGCLVDLLSRAGLLKEALRLIRSMPMEANAVVWGALLAGCKLFGDTELAESVLLKLIELEPWNSGNYIQLSKIYTSTNRWDAVANLRSSMLENGIWKLPGYSLMD